MLLADPQTRRAFTEPVHYSGGRAGTITKRIKKHKSSITAGDSTQSLHTKNKLRAKDRHKSLHSKLSPQQHASAVPRPLFGLKSPRPISYRGLRLGPTIRHCACRAQDANTRITHNSQLTQATVDVLTPCIPRATRLDHAKRTRRSAECAKLTLHSARITYLGISAKKGVPQALEQARARFGQRGVLTYRVGTRGRSRSGQVEPLQASRGLALPLPSTCDEPNISRD